MIPSFPNPTPVSFPLENSRKTCNHVVGYSSPSRAEGGSPETEHLNNARSGMKQLFTSFTVLAEASHGGFRQALWPSYRDLEAMKSSAKNNLDNTFLTLWDSKF